MTTTAIPNRPDRAISLESILAARQRVYQAAVRTPLVRLYYDDAPAEIYLKLESFQPIGSFKLRGAYNAISLLSPEDRAKGVWTISAGNAAQGVALAARIMKTRCEVLVMDTAPAAKLDFQRYKRSRQRPGLAPRTAQHRPQTALRREEIHQCAALTVGATVEHVGGLAGWRGGRHGVLVSRSGIAKKIAAFGSSYWYTQNPCRSCRRLRSFDL